MKCHITDDLSLSRPLEGPLAAHIGRFAQWAREQGYARSSRYKRILLSAGLSRWLGDHRITACQIASERIPAYLKAEYYAERCADGTLRSPRKFQPERDGRARSLGIVRSSE